VTSNWPPFSAIVEANSQQWFTNGGFTINGSNP
jgi:hypothetical protein